MAASLAMAKGDWAKCIKLIMSLRIWGLFPNREATQDMLQKKIKVESLKTYLLTYSGVYESIALSTLSTMFDLELTEIHSIVSKMIIEEELQASHDQPTQTIVIHKEEPTVLQSLALHFADKATQFVENNERQFDFRGRGRGRGKCDLCVPCDIFWILDTFFLWVVPTCGPPYRWVGAANTI
jgi:translation initiation factor 3 subunit C